MGFLTVNGMLVTYNEYRDKICAYKALGLRQYANLHSIFKKRQIEAQNLHWGEEIEYHLYSIDEKTRTVKLCCDASGILKEINPDTQSMNGFKLMPEFGDWMIEAVPSAPYNAYSRPEELLSCLDKISLR